MDWFHGWIVGLSSLALALTAPVAAQAQAYNKQGFWRVGVSEDGDMCTAEARGEDGDFMIMVMGAEATFGYFPKAKPAPARAGVIELGPYAFDFQPTAVEAGYLFEDALNAKAATALYHADSLGLKLDGREVFSMDLAGTGYTEALDAVSDCSNGKSGWWGKGATATDTAPHGDSSGTGFFVTSTGIGVTNAHVVAGCTALSSPRWGAVTLLAVDKAADLAVFKTARTDGAFVALRPRGPKLGEPLTVAGFPLLGLLGDGVKITTGVVSALSGIQGDRSTIQISAPIQPGNSGGPIIDAGGQLIGVAVSRLKDLEVAKATGGMLPQNINFGVPVPILQSFLEENAIVTPAKAPAQAGLDAMPFYTFPLLCKGS